MKHKHRKPETVKVGNVVVKIYRRQKTINGADYTVFEVSDYTSGRRILRSFSDHGTAMAEATRIARQLASGDATAATMRNADAASFGRALELLAPTGVSLEVACGDYARGYELVGDAVVEACKFYSTRRTDLLLKRTVAEVVAELLETKQARGASAVYLKDLRYRLSRFAEAFAVDIGTVTTAAVQRFMDGLKLSPTTVKNFRTVLHTFFQFAEARGYIFKGGNPVTDTEGVKANGGTIQIFTPSEMAGLLAAAPKTFLPFLAIGGFAGLRSAEIERLEWKDIDLAGGFVHLAAEKAKTRARRLVPIADNLRQWLAPYSRLKGNVWKGTAKELQQAQVAAAAGAGIAWKRNGLRHSFCSYRLAQTQDVGKVALEAGNSPDVIFRNYREAVKPEEAKRWFAIAPKQPANVIAMKVEAVHG